MLSPAAAAESDDRQADRCGCEGGARGDLQQTISQREGDTTQCASPILASAAEQSTHPMPGPLLRPTQQLPQGGWDGGVHLASKQKDMYIHISE
jgi:hypothetical protein